ncbi:hypothetical protein SK128_009582, partial [Halocaridina rubra]
SEEWLDDWTAIAEVVSGGVVSGVRKDDKDTWWWDEEVQESIRRKRIVKTNRDSQSDEENKQKYKEMQSKTKRKVTEAREKA